MTRVDKGKRSRPRLVCTKAKVGAGCKYRSVVLEDVIEAITHDDAWWVSEAPRGSEQAQREWEALEAERLGSEETISRLTHELVRGGGSIAIANALREEEVSLRAIEVAAEKLSSRLARETPNGLRARLSALQEALVALPFDAEVVNRRLRENLSSITVWARDDEEGQAASLDFNWLQGGDTSLPLRGFPPIKP